MSDQERHDLVQQLGQMMSDISEDCYCAGWLGGTEYMVPELCRRAIEFDRAQRWGHGTITPARARVLWDLAEQAGCWADTDYDCVGYVAFEPFPIPPHFTEEIDRAQSVRDKEDQSDF